MVDAPIFEPGQRCGPYIVRRLLEPGVPEAYLASLAEKPNTPVYLQCADIRRTGHVTPPEAQWSAALTKLSGLRDPLVPRLLDAGVHEGNVRWIASEHAPGRSFPVFGTTATAPVLGEILAMGLFVARAMAVAKAAGLFHGNLSLRSIVVTDAGEGVDASIHVIGLGTVELFGLPPDIARRSPLFRAPEQLAGEAMDARSDIYSFGMILYTLIARRPPFWTAGDAPPPNLLELTMGEVPPSLSGIAGCSQLVSDVIKVAIQKEPGERFPDWIHFGSALNACFRHARADAAARSKDEKQKAEREREQGSEAHYVEGHPERDGVQSGFRPLGLADMAALEDAGEPGPRAAEDIASSPPATPPASTQRSVAAPEEPRPSPPEEPSEIPAPLAPRASERRAPRHRRALIYAVILLLAGVALGGSLGVALVMRSFKPRTEVANAPLVVPALLMLAAPEASPSLPDSPRAAGKQQEPASRELTSKRAPHRTSPAASPRPAASFSMEDWDPLRRTLVR